MKSIAKWKHNVMLKKCNPLFRPIAFNRKRGIFNVDDVNKIRMMYESGHLGTLHLAELFKCSEFAIRGVVKYKTYLLDNREKSLIEMQDNDEIRPDYT